MAIVPNYIVFRNKNAQFFHENLEGGGGVVVLQNCPKRRAVI